MTTKRKTEHSVLSNSNSIEVASKRVKAAGTRKPLKDLSNTTYASSIEHTPSDSIVQAVKEAIIQPSKGNVQLLTSQQVETSPAGGVLMQEKRKAKGTFLPILTAVRPHETRQQEFLQSTIVVTMEVSNGSLVCSENLCQAMTSEQTPTSVRSLEGLHEQSLPVGTKSLLCAESFKKETKEATRITKDPASNLLLSPRHGRILRFDGSPINFFEYLPEEIVLQILKYINCSWKQLNALRLVCKHWSRLIQDRSLLEQFDHVPDTFVAMIRNEMKHHSKIADYLGNNSQREISRDMRGILIDWLVDVAAEFQMETDTLFFSVFYADRYLSETNTAISRSKLQLLGVSTLLIAAKYDEIYAPRVDDLVYICDGAYSADEILSMEVHILNVLKFDVTVCTSKQFLDYFLNSVSQEISHKSQEDIVRVHCLAQYLAELSLLDYRFILCRPSLLGASLAGLALHGFGVSAMALLEQESNHPRRDIIACMRDLYDHYVRAANMPLQSVRTKFNREVYRNIAGLSIPPLPSH